MTVRAGSRPRARRSAARLLPHRAADRGHASSPSPAWPASPTSGARPQGADHTRDRLFARQKALSILSELRAYVEGGDGRGRGRPRRLRRRPLAERDALDRARPARPRRSFVAPDHPLSGNVLDRGEWRWYRRITVQHFPGVVDARPAHLHGPRVPSPPEAGAPRRADGRGLLGRPHDRRRVPDDAGLRRLPPRARERPRLVGLHGLHQAVHRRDPVRPRGAQPGPRVPHALDHRVGLRARRAVRARTRTRPGSARTPRRGPTSTPARCRPGPRPRATTCPDDDAGPRQPRRPERRPIFANDYSPASPTPTRTATASATPARRTSTRTANGEFDVGNPVPYAMADQHNHAMRWPDENAKFEARVAAGLEEDDTPTWRLLLDRMIADPDEVPQRDPHQPPRRAAADAGRAQLQRRREGPGRPPGLARRRAPRAPAPAAHGGVGRSSRRPALARLRLQDGVPDDRAR